MLRRIVFSLEEIAAFFGVRYATARLWIMQQKLVGEVHLFLRDGRPHVRISPDQFARLMDLKCHIASDLSKPVAREYKRRLEQWSRAGKASAIAKLARLKASSKLPGGPDDESNSK